MMSLIKIVVGALLTALLLLVFVINFSVVPSRLECPGNIYLPGSVRAVTVYLKFEKYRWWVIWSSSDGAVFLEIPYTTVDYFGYISKVGDQYAIFDSFVSPRKLKGNFSTLSKALAISTSEGFFEGVCRELSEVPMGH